MRRHVAMAMPLWEEITLGRSMPVRPLPAQSHTSWFLFQQSLFFAGNAYIMVPPKNTTANEGTRVKLSCQAEGYPNNITYRWFKNGVDIQQVAGLMTRAGVYADGSFVISTVIKEDTGWYKCRPSNGLGPPPEAHAYLNVTCEYSNLLIYTHQWRGGGS